MKTFKIVCTAFVSSLLIGSCANARSINDYVEMRQLQYQEGLCEQAKNLTYSILYRHLGQNNIAQAQEHYGNLCPDGNLKVMEVILKDGRGCSVSISLRQNRVIRSECR